MEPERYPRIPYLWPPDEGSDHVVPPAEVATWLAAPVVVEEKLDGANIALWAEDGQVLAATRGGVDSRDRSGQLGRLRAWVAQRHDVLSQVLTPGPVLYGEWLWLTHSVRYDRLPEWLVLLDCWTPGAGWADVDERQRTAQAAALTTPPVVFTGRLHRRSRLTELMGRSAYGPEPMEGLVLRTADGRRCKVVRPGFRRIDDAAFAAGRPHNTLASQGTSGEVRSLST